ncbi:DUF1800 family protein [Georgenia alba]|uniref:DUF1800 family protein n=1 Tax=Georgenia alba TaxID=2233858 RepID=A0ABW2Q4N6_9MICO
MPSSDSEPGGVDTAPAPPTAPAPDAEPGQTDSGATAEPLADDTVDEPAPAGSDLSTSGTTSSLPLATTAAWHLARRAAHAPTAEIAARIAAMGTHAWIDRQLEPEGIGDSRLEDYVSRYFPWSRLPAAQLENATGGRPFLAEYQVRIALLARARFTERVLLETVVETLSDHIYVPLAGKGAPFSPDWDQTLRRHALGPFNELLHAALRHPAVLRSFDNQHSTKDSPNENLGRELLELMTVGSGHYTEEDVRQSALLLTGHTIDWDTLEYAFVPERHHVGALQIMGFAHPNASAEAGPTVLAEYVDHLAHHEATALRLARRFAVRYISDAPSAAVVEDLAAAYLDGDTSIASLVRATLTHEEFRTSAGRKWKRPLEYVMTIARAARPAEFVPDGRVGANREFDTGAYGWLVGLGQHLPRGWPGVDGYPDTAPYWRSPNRTLAMWNGTVHAVKGDASESGVTDWAQVLEIGLGDNVLRTAERITQHLTGFTWPRAHLEDVAAMLGNGGERAVGPSDVITEHSVTWHIKDALQLVFASPYGFLR